MRRTAAILVAILVTGVAYAAGPDDATLVLDLQGASSLSSSGIAVDGLEWRLGGAEIRLGSGEIYPAMTRSGSAYEFVFIGSGRLALDPSDPVERDQLQQFTGGPVLDESFGTAVFVTTDPELIEKLTAGESVESKAREAAELWKGWSGSPERRALDVGSGILASLADSEFEPYFVASVGETSAGDFLFSVDPSLAEPVSLGQFVPLETTAGEERRIRRELRRQQRRGKLLGIEAEDLGHWNQWMSIAHDSVPARPIFEPRHYQMEVSVDASMRIHGSGTIEIESSGGRARIVQFDLHNDLTVDSVEDAEGRPLLHVQSPRSLTVILGEPVGSGSRTSVRIDWSGVMLNKEWSSYALRDPTGWYPRAGEINRATFDVTYRYPSKLELLSMGRLVDSGTGGSESWQRRVAEEPVRAFTFEIGHFDKETVQAGHITVTIAYDPESADKSKIARDMMKSKRSNRQVDFDYVGIARKTRDEIRQQFVQALTYMEEKYGELPFHELTVVTVPRSFSQSLQGFITLSTEMMAEYDWEEAVNGYEDRRTVIAHEVAHQWWGHALGASSYRDYWIAEALSSWAALDYGRNVLDWSNRYRIGPTTRWQSHLTTETIDGRAYESLGPLVIGPRVESSHAQSVYERLVYYKGPVVLDTIARTMGESKFRRVLRKMLSEESDGILTTEEMIGYLGTAGGPSIDRFAERFIYGTGIPEIEYDYTIERSGAGWRIRGEAVEIAPMRFEYRIERAAGGFNVGRKLAESRKALDSLRMKVPVQVAIDQGGSRQYAENTMTISGGSSRIDLEVPWEPSEFLIDRDRSSFARFFSIRNDPKRLLLRRGNRLVAEGNLGEAVEAFNACLASEPSTDLGFDLGFDLGDYYRKPILEQIRRSIDADAHIGLGRIHVERGDFEAAARAIDSSRRALKRDERSWIEGEIAVLEARMDLARGRAEDAHRRLRRVLLEKKSLDSPEGFALFAVTSHRIGADEDLEIALDEAADRGVDITAIAEAGAHQSRDSVSVR